MSESIDELETELEKQDNTLTANRFRELMDTLDVDEGAQELALAILKEEGLQAVQVQEHGGMKSKVTRAGGGSEPHRKCVQRFYVAAADKIARPTPSQPSQLQKRSLQNPPFAYRRF